MTSTYDLTLGIPAFLMLALAAVGAAKEPDKTIEIVRKDGKLVFMEKGKTKPGPVTVVVGETIRWVNRDREPHTVKSVAAVEGAPVFETGAIPPGEHQDVSFNIDVYRRAGGRTANFVRLRYRGSNRAEDAGELDFLSAARR